MPRNTFQLMRAGIWFSALLYWVAFPFNNGFRYGWGSFVDAYETRIFRSFIEGYDGYSHIDSIFRGLFFWALLASAVAVAFVSSSSLKTSPFDIGMDSATPPGITGAQVASYDPKSVWMWVTNVALWFGFLYVWIIRTILGNQMYDLSFAWYLKFNTYHYIKYVIVDSEEGLSTRMLNGLEAVSIWVITAVAIYLLVAVFRPKSLVAPVNNVQYSVPPGILD
jgi:hypothetical protein